MAIFIAQVQVMSRAEGKSSVAAAAYRAGLSLLDESTGIRHDYSRRGGVAAVETFLPHGAPEFLRAPSQLWNAAERAENRKNSRVARELLVALPAELDEPERLALSGQLARELVARFKVGVLLAVHAPSKGGDDRNHHAHLLFTTREIGAEGFGKKTRQLDDQTSGPVEVEAIRRMVEAAVNDSLARAGKEARVDSRSLADQAAAAAAGGDFSLAVSLDRRATIHVGQAGTARIRTGLDSDRGAHNDYIREQNARRLAAAADYAREVEREARACGAWVESPESAHAQALCDRYRRELGTDKAPTPETLRPPVPAETGSARRDIGPGIEYERQLRQQAGRLSSITEQFLASMLSPQVAASSRSILSQAAFQDWTRRLAIVEKDLHRATTRPARRRRSAEEARVAYEAVRQGNMAWRRANPMPSMWRPIARFRWRKEAAARTGAESSVNEKYLRAVRRTLPEHAEGYRLQSELLAESLRKLHAEREQRWPMDFDTPSARRELTDRQNAGPSLPSPQGSSPLPATGRRRGGPR